MGHTTHHNQTALDNSYRTGEANAKIDAHTSDGIFHCMLLSDSKGGNSFSS